MFFKFRKKSKQEGTSICINESLLQTKSQDVIRCINISAHFNTKNEEEIKQATHDMVRTCLIAAGYMITSDDAINHKEKFQEAVKAEINKTIAGLLFACDMICIENISKVEQRR